MVLQWPTRLIRTSLICAVLPLIWGCSQDAPISLFPNHLNYIEYSEGRPSKELVVQKGDHLYDMALRLLQDNPNSWDIDWSSYTPSHYFRGDGFNLNCKRDKVVLNFRSANDRWIQLSKRIPGCEDKIISVKRKDKSMSIGSASIDPSKHDTQDKVE